MDRELIIKKLCTEKGISLKELAEKVGISANMLSMANSGNVGLSMKTIFKIADVLGVTVGELFSDSRDSKGRICCPHCGKEITIELR
ncbi:MAG: helix-turn-helix transcriptional regulator [Bacteroidales bacterium]|nr:helix-turn-helix transcriptional regulator [Salinivirgaceae bacterium]MBR4214012.1 helix-turn-helix transcriptional regulator [Bacteroidales bacterium]